VAGVETVKCVAAAGVTVIGMEPVIEAATVSVPVIVWVPAVLRVAENVPVPLVKVELAGRVAAGSVEVKRTVPE